MADGPPRSDKKEKEPDSILIDPTITRVEVLDLRFPTSRDSIGSDAVNKNPDYSAAYCILQTDSELKGYGLTFTLGRGNELCVKRCNISSVVPWAAGSARLPMILRHFSRSHRR